MSYFTAITPIGFYLMYYYFLNFVKNYFFYRLAYLFFVTMYRTCIFYYLFYLELIKYELKLDGPKQMKTIYNHYSKICELNDCINQIFGWSNFVTILYCFELPQVLPSEVSARQYKNKLPIYMVFCFDAHPLYLSHPIM